MAQVGRLIKTVKQRRPPKRPRKPTSQALGARVLSRQHWRTAESLLRRSWRKGHS